MVTYDWRRHKRERREGPVAVTVNVIRENRLEKVSFSAEAVDISQGGIGLLLDVPLEPGFVRFKDKNEQKAGMVMWNKKLENNKYRVGIQFDLPLNTV